MEPIVFLMEEVERAGLPEAMQAHLTTLQASDDRFLYFHNAVLARAEVNRNKDEVDVAGLHELAATLPMTAIDLEHKHQNVIGFYTDARVSDGALYTDGLIFKNRFPKEAEGIRNGSYRKSIEATAARAQCAECLQEFTMQANYCEHLKNKTAVRKLFGLKAEGGAATLIPAGTQTVFDPNGLMLIASLEDETPEEESDEEKEKKAQDKKEMEGALRAAQRFAAAVDLLTINPRAQTPLSSPVLAPFLWDPNEALVKKMIADAVAFSMKEHAALQATAQENQVQASLTSVEKLRAELTAKLDALKAAQEEMQLKLQSKTDPKGIGVTGIGGFTWLGESQEENKKEPIGWG